MNNTQERAILMRLSKGCPGDERGDEQMTKQVKSEHNFGKDSGKWQKRLFPPQALKPIRQLDTQAANYHKAVTLPFDRGIGILPAVLIVEYGDRMRDFRAKRQNLIENHFIAKLDEWIDWAKNEHNGTFNPEDYPSADEFRQRFYFQTEPLPVPNSAHFMGTLSTLLGTDAQSVDIRIADAEQEARRELLRRLIAPVQHMAKVLSKEDGRIFETVVTNISDVAELAPKLNLAGDPMIDQFCAEMRTLAAVGADQLREDQSIKSDKQKQAEELLKKLSGYKI